MCIGKRVGQVAAALTFFATTLAHASKWNMPEGVTAISHEVYGLHMLVFWICVAIGVVVFGIMFYSVFAHRRSKHPIPATFHESTTVEIIWTIIPFFILIGMAIPAAGTLIKMYDTRNSDMTIKITGLQWRWQYDYVDSGISFVSSLSQDSNVARELHSGIDPKDVPNYLLSVDHNLVVPVGKKVRLLITSDDVIHGWWVPDLAVKRDAIPGFVNEVWFKADETGVFRGQCTVLCGRDHGFMPIVVEVKSVEEYDAWTKAQKGSGAEVAAAAAPAAVSDASAAAPTPTVVAAADAPKPKPVGGPSKLSHDDLMKNGKTVYEANCQACHQAGGQGLAPTFPTLIGDKVVTGPAEGHITQVLKGKNLMPPFGDKFSDADLAAVATYERNSWGNKAGDIQPAQVAALRGK